MKKALLIVALIATAFCAKAQVNIQEQYDFNREHLTTTLEMFKTDNWGSTFFFTDIYHPQDSVKPVGYYTEIARGLNFWKDSKLGALSAHVEWNGGQFANNAWLFGVEYLLHNEDFTNTFTFELLYKSIEKQTDNTPLQFTFIWNMQNLLNIKGLLFDGFVDVWGEKYTWADPDGTTETTDFVIISEPQLWYNIGQFFNCENLFIGGEVELAYNFQGGWNGGAKFHKNKGFTAAPACGLRWNF